MEFLLAILVVGGLVAGFLGLRRSRGDVMGYHDIETPRANQTRRDGDDEGTGGVGGGG